MIVIWGGLWMPTTFTSLSPTVVVVRWKHSGWSSWGGCASCCTSEGTCLGKEGWGGGVTEVCALKPVDFMKATAAERDGVGYHRLHLSR